MNDLSPISTSAQAGSQRLLRAYERFGAHPCAANGVDGVRFAVWAPNASGVSVIGDFNGWSADASPLACEGGNGVWSGFVAGVSAGALYKFAIWDRGGQRLPDKSDPFAFAMQRPPETASVVAAASAFAWSDGDWMARRGETSHTRAPISIYEVHLGSWMREGHTSSSAGEGRQLSYAELADRLVPYVKDLGFTHIELLPVSEHPFEGSWGYQPVGLYAPTSRLGSADDLRLLVDRCHAAGIGVILDWAAGHFPDDAHGLAGFDGTHLYEHADPRQGRHADWGSLIYNLGRTEVVRFLIDNAHFWLDEFHIDGLRVDAVASMLYLDYSRAPGQWVANAHGGNENLEAIAFLRQLNTEVYGAHPGAFTVAEESTSWPMVSRPVHEGGLGFGYKWNMGWMNDTLRYIGHDPVHRKHHHNQLTFPLMYAFSENFVLPLSHDEVVHGKRSLIGRMPGDAWQRFANYRAYLAYMFTHPGKKLLFMGAELAQEREWSHMRGLDWHLRELAPNAGITGLVRDLNRLYREWPALHGGDCENSGFKWIDCDDRAQSVLSYLRFGPAAALTRANATSPRSGATAPQARDVVLVVCNFTPVPRHGYRVGVPVAGVWRERLNTDSAYYGGSNMGNVGAVVSAPQPRHGYPQSLSLTLPPLAVVVLEPDGDVEA